jgi:hypothetical protein
MEFNKNKAEMGSEVYSDGFRSLLRWVQKFIQKFTTLIQSEVYSTHSVRSNEIHMP